MNLYENRRMSRRIFAIALPVIVQMLVTYILMFTDTAFIGQYDKASLSAVNNVLNPFFSALSFFFALANGTTILIAQSIGAGKKHRARLYAEVSFFVHGLIGIAYFFFWLFLGKPILSLIGTRGEIFILADQYLFIITFMFLYNGIGMTMNSCFEGSGWTTPLMISSIVKSAMNIFLDYAMIFGKFGFAEMGIQGAALATVISDFAGTLLLVPFMMRLPFFKIALGRVFSVPRRFYGRVVRLGLPAGAEFMLWSLGQTGLLAILNSIDRFAAGSFGIVSILGLMFVQCYTGMGVATTNLVGNAWGAGKKDEAKRAGNLSIIYSVIFCLAVSIIFIIMPVRVLSLFSKDLDYVKSLLAPLFLVLLTSLPRAVNIISGNAIRGTGNTIWMMNTQIAGTASILAVSMFLVYTLKMGINGVFIAIFIDETWRGILNYVKFSWFSFGKLTKVSQPDAIQ